MHSKIKALPVSKSAIKYKRNEKSLSIDETLGDLYDAVSKLGSQIYSRWHRKVSAAIFEFFFERFLSKTECKISLTWILLTAVFVLKVPQKAGIVFPISGNISVGAWRAFKILDGDVTNSFARRRSRKWLKFRKIPPNIPRRKHNTFKGLSTFQVAVSNQYFHSLKKIFFCKPLCASFVMALQISLENRDSRVSATLIK